MERQVTTEDAHRGLGGALLLVREILTARGLEISRYRKLAWTARLLTVALTAAGLTFVWYTAKPARIAPPWVQVLVAVSVLTFGSVGFWMLCRRQASHVLSWMFCAAGFLGAVVYASATYSNLGIEGRHLAGGLVVGWIGDVLFLPAISCLLPAFLAVVPDGSPPSRLWRWAVGVPAAGASALLFLAALLEPNLVTRPGITAPLGGLKLSAASGALQGAGLATLLVAISIGFVSLRERLGTLEQDDPRSSQLRWYGYGAAISLVALVPYVFTAILNVAYMPQANVLARAWGAAVAAAIPISAIPAVLGWAWSDIRTKRLLRAAVIAAIVTSVHELMVKNFADSLLDPASEATPAKSGLFITYGVTLLVAVIIEPGASLLHHFMDRVADLWSARREPSNYWLEQALEHVKASKRGLDMAMARRRRWGEEFSQRSRQGDAPSPSRRIAKRRNEVGIILGRIDHESADARMQLAELQKDFGALLAATQPAENRAGERLPDLTALRAGDGSELALAPVRAMSLRRPDR